MDHPTVVLSVAMSTLLGTRHGASAPEPPSDRRPLRLRGDLIAVAAAALLVTASALIGWRLTETGTDVLVGWPPLLAEWLPHVGPGTVPAVLVALLVALRGPAVAQRLSWRPLLVVAFVASWSWTLALALVDGWFRGVVERLGTVTEYLQEVPRTPSVSDFLLTFADRIVAFQPTSLVTHASGHPPAATLVYVLLDHAGFPGGGYAGMLTLTLGASSVVAVALTLSALAGPDVARRYLPFGVLFPGAVWVGVSADGLFAAVFAWGVALLALGAARRTWPGLVLSLAGGLVLGLSLFFSYGLAAGGLVPVVAVLITRRVVPLVLAAVGVAVVVGLFARAGFWWLDGYELVKVRYYQPTEYGLLRPYGYWVWANFASTALALGPAVVAGMRRVAWRPRAAPLAVVALVAAAVVAVLAADVSGLSKAETERIWLPFGTWMVAATALLPRTSARAWLLGQAALALVVNHFLLTTW